MFQTPANKRAQTSNEMRSEPFFSFLSPCAAVPVLKRSRTCTKKTMHRRHKPSGKEHGRPRNGLKGLAPLPFPVVLRAVNYR